MCGLAGAAGWIDSTINAAAARMNQAMTHRGPDDEGIWRSTENGFGAVLAFRRLAILDLSPLAHQPMIDRDGGDALTFNGEIYNHHELRRELQRDGVQFRSTGDTEVLLRAWIRWGPGAVSRLRGMFAFAVWDSHRRSVMLVRDRVGIKPLYFCEISTGNNRKTILFASEVRALLASGLVERTLNPAGLSSYVWNGFVAGPQTIVKGVQLLPAGSMAEINCERGDISMSRYWQLPRCHPERDGEHRLRQELLTAAQQHLVSDVPLGVFLSGGIDSSAIAALAMHHHGAEVRTFNIAFDEKQFDESTHAQAVARALGTHHSEIRLGESDFRNQLPDALACIDQPTFDAINTYFISRAVREAGITVALAGTGGDELFGGYRSFRDETKAWRLSRFANALPAAMIRGASTSIARMVMGRFGEVPPQTRWGKLSDVLTARGNPIAVHQSSYSIFTRDFTSELLHNGYAEETCCGLDRLRAQELSELVGERLDLHAISMLELSLFIGERLLRDTDCASMAASLEVRVPLLDHKVIEAAAAVDAARRFQPLGKKQLLRDMALERLDPNLFERPKSGFELPIAVWCRNELKPELDRTFADAALCAAVGLNHKAVQRLWRAFQDDAPGIYWSRVWSLYVLLQWCRNNCVTLRG